MQASLLHELRRRRFSIRARWDALVRAEPVTTPLALPEALVHLIDTTLDELFTAFENPAAQSGQPAPGNGCRSCCGRNPFLAYFTSGEQAMREGLVLAQAASAPLDPVERDASLAELEGALARISRRDFASFCGVCQFQHLALPAPQESLAIPRW